jgi:hypothetical protein
MAEIRLSGEYVEVVSPRVSTDTQYGLRFTAARAIAATNNPGYRYGVYLTNMVLDVISTNQAGRKRLVSNCVM